MAERRKSGSKTGIIYEFEETDVEGSFLSANVERKNLGSFRVPKSFDKKFGKNLPNQLLFKCKNFIWKGKYDVHATMIYGLHNFVLYYGIRILNLVQFDYHGGGKFTVKIFKETAIECNYPSTDPNEFRRSENPNNWRVDEYLINSHSLEYQKSFALLCFNGFQDENEYGEIDIISFYIDPRLLNLRLNPNLKSFYKNWKHGTKIQLQLFKRTWEIEIEWMAGRCSFVTGWYDFARETELAVGDSLVLYKHGDDDYVVNVCIFKYRDYVNDVGEGESMTVDRSFYKMVSRSFINRGLFIVPKLVKDKYNQKLKRTNKIEISGTQWFAFYNERDGDISGLEKMIKIFSLREKETIICTMDDSNIISARIYQEDGMELDYIERMLLDSFNNDPIWYWHIDHPTDSDSEEEEIAEAYDESASEGNDNSMEITVNNRIHEFSTTLTQCHVNNKSQGVFIPKFVSPEDREWTAGERISLTTDRGSWNIGLAVSDGRVRCSAGWNKFAKENELAKGGSLVFNMVEEAGGVVFKVRKVRRS